MGARVDVELENGEWLSLRFPRGHMVGGGTCECETPAVEWTTSRRQVLRERVFGSVPELLACLFPAEEAEVELSGLTETNPAVHEVSSGELPGPVVEMLGALLSRDAGRIHTALKGFRGAYPSARAFIEEDVRVEIPTAVWSWLRECVDYGAAASRYRTMGSIFVSWGGRTYVFELK